MQYYKNCGHDSINIWIPNLKQIGKHTSSILKSRIEWNTWHSPKQMKFYTYQKESNQELASFHCQTIEGKETIFLTCISHFDMEDKQ